MIAEDAVHTFFDVVPGGVDTRVARPLASILAGENQITARAFVLGAAALCDYAFRVARLLSKSERSVREKLTENSLPYRPFQNIVIATGV